MRIGWGVELLPKYIGIDFLVAVADAPRVEAWTKACKELIGAGDDRGACIDKQATTWVKPLEAFFRDAQRKIYSQCAAAVPVGARLCVQQIWRVGDDQIAAFVDAAENVAQRGAHPGDAIERRVYPAIAQRLRVDIGENDIGLGPVCEQVGNAESSGSRSAADVDDRASAINSEVLERLAQRAHKAVGIGSKENAVRRLCRKRGVDKQMRAEARKSHLAAKELTLALQLAACIEEREHHVGQLGRLEAPAPAEHAREHVATAVDAANDSAVSGGSDSSEMIIAGPELSSQRHQRLLGWVHDIARVSPARSSVAGSMQSRRNCSLGNAETSQSIPRPADGAPPAGLAPMES